MPGAGEGRSLMERPIPVCRYFPTTATWQGRQSSPGAGAASDSELDASAHHKAARIAGSGNLAERRRREETRADGGELGVIENVEAVGAYFKLPPFPYSNDFSERHVELVPAGSGEDVPADRREGPVIRIE